MKKEELLAIGLTEEQAAQVFALNGKDLTRLNNRLQTKEQQLALAQKETASIAGRLTQVEAMDVEGLQAEAKQWRQKYEQDMAALRLEHAVDAALLQAKAKNPKLVKAALDRSAITMKEGQVQGLQEQLAKLRETDGYLFGGAEQAATPAVVAPAGKAQVKTLSRESFRKMGYLERIGLKEKDPALYETLKGE